MSPVDLKSKLQEFKYNSLPLVEMLSFLYSHYSVTANSELDSNLAFTLVDYKFKPTITLQYTIETIEILLGAKNFQGPQTGTILPFNLSDVIVDLKSLGILNNKVNFKLNLESTASDINGKSYVFSITSPNTLTNQVEIGGPKIEFKYIEKYKISPEQDEISTYLFNELIRIVGQVKVGSSQINVYNGLNVEIHYIENAGRLPPYEIFNFSHNANNYLISRFFNTP